MAESAAPVSFGRDVQPLLGEHCYACHGPGDQQGGLRLDTFDAATVSAIVPGEPAKSELLKRIASHDPHTRMPPPEIKKPPLTAQQIDILRRWIESGAEYESHWSFQTPTRSKPPSVANGATVRNAIDSFIVHRLEQEGLTPAKQADRRTLARRVTLDLTGLPPSPELVQEFVQDKSPNAYEKLVDKLLASPAWGEHRARYWLDYARYADTHGLHFDNYREMWAYRDWVIHAFNQNMPYDQFTIENLAGDLLPNSTLDQTVASGFNRCNITTNEGGIIDEEYLVLYTRDRVDTTSQVWLGLTAGCAVCHDHKYDPLSQKEFYQMAAYFNNTTQHARDGNVKDTKPRVFAPPVGTRKRWEELPGLIAEAEKKVGDRREQARADFDAWLASASPGSVDAAAPKEGLHFHTPLAQDGTEYVVALDGKSQRYRLKKSALEEGVGGAKALMVKDHVARVRGAGRFDSDDQFSCAAWVKISKDKPTGAIISRMKQGGRHFGWDFWIGERRIGAHLSNAWPNNAIKVEAVDQIPPDEWVHVAMTYDGTKRAAGVRLYVNGFQVPTKTHTDKLTGTLSVRNREPLRIGERGGAGRLVGSMLQDIRVYNQNLDIRQVAAVAAAPVASSVLAQRPEDRAPSETEALYSYWLATNDEVYAKQSKRLAQFTRERDDIQSRSTYAHVMQERNSPAEAYVLFRGEYDQRRDRVTPGTPSFLPPMPNDAPANRLGFAQWLLLPEHPLTARVTVNRFWQEVFGEGLVSSSGDFGISGMVPSHPELLDWLAVDFRESGWDVKRLVKLMVTSATYRQAAIVTPEKLKRDKSNSLLSRGPRFRMDAEMVRDHALAVSGLLVKKLGGPSVKPYQPPGVWEAVAMNVSNTQKYRRERGAKLYRRSLYTFWKRSAPPASLETFNAPSREFCIVKRERTNTPLQSLVTLNDEQFFEAARVLAEMAIKNAGDDYSARVEYITRRLIARSLTPREQQIVRDSFQKLLAEFQAKPDEARRAIAVGETTPDASLDPVQLATWTTLTNELMNLDEVLNK